MRRPPRRRDLLQAALLAAVPAWPGGPARADAGGIELTTLALHRDDGQLQIEFAARLRLARVVEDALQRGLPLYFVAEATLLRRRWYWRDPRIARVRRTWRLAFQPLTSTWRVNLGALGQTYATLAEALDAVSATGRWKIADLADLDPDARHYVDFSYRLDASQLPGPLQIGVTGQADWQLRVDRELAVEPAP